jgi:hypothetical protein
MAEEITARLGPHQHYELCAIADDLFEPAEIEDTAAVLIKGLAAESSANPPVRWVRGGRDLHVFTARAGVAGFVSVPRVVIGQENAVLCTEELADAVLRVCTAIAARDYRKAISTLGEQMGKAGPSFCCREQWNGFAIFVSKHSPATPSLMSRREFSMVSTLRQTMGRGKRVIVLASFILAKSQ